MKTNTGITQGGLAPAARVVPCCAPYYETPMLNAAQFVLLARRFVNFLTVRRARPKPDVVFKEFLLSLVPHVRDCNFLVQAKKFVENLLLV